MNATIRCYICGRPAKGKFSLATMTDDTDRVFIMHDKCSEQVEKESTMLVKVVSAKALDVAVDFIKWLQAKGIIMSSKSSLSQEALDKIEKLLR